MKNIFIPIASSLLYQMIIENKECFYTYIYIYIYIYIVNVMCNHSICCMTYKFDIYFSMQNTFFCYFILIFTIIYFFQYLSRVMILLIYR